IKNPAGPLRHSDGDWNCLVETICVDETETKLVQLNIHSEESECRLRVIEKYRERLAEIQNDAIRAARCEHPVVSNGLVNLRTDSWRRRERRCIGPEGDS